MNQKMLCRRHCTIELTLIRMDQINNVFLRKYILKTLFLQHVFFLPVYFKSEDPKFAH